MNKSIAALSVVAAAFLSTSAVHAEDIYYESGWSLFPEGQDAQTDSNFGWTLYTHENLLFVGTSDGVDSAHRSFLVYDTHDWSVVMRISPETPDAEFGRQIVIQDSRIWISGTDAIYTFDLLTGDQLHTFVEPETDTHGRYGDSFAVEDGMLYVGDLVAPNADAPPSTLGVVYIYETETNTLVDTLVTPNTSGGDGFGTTVQAEGDYLCVAVPFITYVPPQPGTITDRGMIYVYDRSTLELTQTIASTNSHTWGQTVYGPDFILENGNIVFEIEAPGCQSGSYREHGIVYTALNGPGSGSNWASCFGDSSYETMYGKDGLLLVDVRYDSVWNNDEYKHSVRLFDLTGPLTSDILLQRFYLDEIAPVSLNVFDIGLAFTSRYLFMGLPTAEDSEGFGRIIVIEAMCNFHLRKADINNDNMIDVFDVFGFLDLWIAQDPDADLYGDGVWDIFDVGIYLHHYNEACE